MVLQLNPNAPTGKVVPGGSVKEFAEAAKDALYAALRVKVPGTEPYYNVYLTPTLAFEGLTAHLLSSESARRKRKKAFTLSSKCQWAVTLHREAGESLTEHRSGFRCWWSRQ